MPLCLDCIRIERRRYIYYYIMTEVKPEATEGTEWLVVADCFTVDAYLAATTHRAPSQRIWTSTLVGIMLSSYFQA